MALESDSSGFLVGEPINLGAMPADISGIRDDVSAIRRIISERWRDHSRRQSYQSTSAARAGSSNQARDSSGRFTGSSEAKVAVPNRSKSSGGAAASAGSAAIAERIRRVSSGGGAELPGRDSAGRFTAGGSSASNKAASVIASIGDRLSRLTDVASGIDDADPAVKAAREVAEPLRRGFEFFQGDKQTSWLKKIFSKLSIFQKEESVYNKVSTKTLKNIEGKTGIQGEDGSFSGGATGSILGRAIPWALGGLAAAGGGIASAVAGAVTAAIAAIFSPIGAAVAAARVAAWGVFTEDGKKFFADLGVKMVDGWGKFTNYLAESSPKTMEFLKKAGDKAGAAIDSVKGTAGKATSFVAEQAKDVGNYLVKSSPKTMAAIDGIKSYFGGEQGNAGAAMKILMDKGWTKEQAAGIAANIQAESDFKTNAKGDGGKAVGIAQWHPDRQKQFETVYGKKLSDASFEEQVGFVDWELRNTEKAAGKRIMNATTAETAAALTEQYYERSALGLRGGVQPERLLNAGRYANIATTTAPSVPLVKMPSAGPIADAPKVVEPLGTSPDRTFTVNIPSQDVGQNLSDRRVAHIASGGIGG